MTMVAIEYFQVKSLILLRMILRILKRLEYFQVKSLTLLRILKHLAYLQVSFTLLKMILRILKGPVRTLRMILRIFKYLEYFQLFPLVCLE